MTKANPSTDRKKGKTQKKKRVDKREEAWRRFRREIMDQECHEAGMDAIEDGWDGHKNAF